MRSYIKVRYKIDSESEDIDYWTVVKIKCAMPPVNGSEFSGLKIRDYGPVVISEDKWLVE